VYSPKGGVGKTTLVLSLGKLASEKIKTCVVEYDFSPGSFISLLDLERQKNILDAVNGRLDWAIQKPYKQKFDAIVGGYPDTPEYIKSDKLVNLLNELDRRYDIVIVDVQPNFIEGCIDIFKKSEKIFIVIEDDFSVTARVIGNIDWARTNDFIDINKVFYIVNKKKGPLKYINITDLKFPIFYEIPYIKNIKPLYDKSFEKYALKILEKMMPDKFREEKKFTLFRRKEKQETIVQPEEIEKSEVEIEKLPETEESEQLSEINVQSETLLEIEQPDMKSEKLLKTEQQINPETSQETKKIQMPNSVIKEYEPEPKIEQISDINQKITNNEEFNQNEEVIKLKLYMDTGIGDIANILKSKFECTDSLISSDVILITAIRNESYLKDMVNAGKKIILLTQRDDTEAIETANRIGIQNILYAPIENIDDLLKVIKGVDNMNVDKINDSAVLSDNDRKNNEQINSVQVDNDQFSNIQINKQNEIDEGVTEILNQLQNLLEKHKETYESRIARQQEVIKEKDAKIEELTKEIEKYKQKEEERKKIFSELQKLLA
jgi:MinD-like ATPase involved in chromosome partitioning or flagellar assembly